MNDQQPNEVHSASAEALRSAIMVAMQAAELVAMRRADQARAAQAASDQDRAAYSERLAGEREAARPVLRRGWDETWWRRASAEEIKDTWQITASWAGTDPYAAATLEEMRRQVRRRFGIELPDDPARTDEVATLLAAARPARTTTRGQSPTTDPEAAQPVDGPDAGSGLADPDEPEFPEPADRVGYEYVVRDAADPAKILDSGALSLDPEAGVADAAIEGLRRFAQQPGPVPSPGEQIDALFAHGRGAVEARDVSGVEIAIYPAGQRDGAPLAVLPGADLSQARAERRAARREVIERRRPASPAQVMAAIRMEMQASHDELLSLRDRLRQLAEAPMQEAEREPAAAPLRQAVEDARGRLSQLRLERRVAEADARGEDGALIPRAELLREHLDEGWVRTATPGEVAGVWEHIAAWPAGEARTLAETHLRAALHRVHGLDPAREADGAQIERELAKRRGTQRVRALDERAAARDARDTAADLNAEGADPVRVRAERERERAEGANAAQDEAAAAALAAAQDRGGRGGGGAGGAGFYRDTVAAGGGEPSPGSESGSGGGAPAEECGSGEGARESGSLNALPSHSEGSGSSHGSGSSSWCPSSSLGRQAMNGPASRLISTSRCGPA